MPTKEEKKRLKEQYQTFERERFDNKLPMSKDNFKKLFDYLDERLGIEDCDDTLKMCLAFFDDNGIENTQKITEWLKENGGFCDCEVLANVEEQFE